MRTDQEKIFSSKAMSYFSLLADTLSYTKSAQMLGITQPALTQQIKKLEKAVGAPLFYSTGKKLRLSDAGYTMLSAAHDVMNIMSSATDEIQRSANAEIGKLSVGILSTIESAVFIDFIEHSYRINPGVDISFHTLSRTDIWKNLENNIIDVAVMYLPDISIKNWKMYDTKKIMTEKLYFIHHDEDLLKQDSGIKYAQSTEYNWVTYPEGFYLDEFIKESFKNKMIDQPKSVAQFSSADQLLNFATRTDTVTALPESNVLAAHLEDGTYASAFEQLDTFDLGLVFRKDKDAIPRVKSFLTGFEDYLNDKNYIDRLLDIKKKRANN